MVAALLTAFAIAAIGSPSTPHGGLTFASVRTDGAAELWSMDARGGNLRRITARSPVAEDVAWSPDGGATFTSYDAWNNGSVWSVTPAGKHPQPLIGATVISGGGGLDLDGGLEWSPDGTMLVVAVADGLRIFDVHGRPVRWLTHGDTIGDSQPAWSPDGKWIAFARYGEIWVVAPFGGTPRRLGDGDDPTWSPAGKEIAYTIDSQLYVMDSDGTHVRRLLTDDCADEAPTWSATDVIAFQTSCGSGNREDIALVRPDGTAQRVFLRNASSPAWSLRADMLMFTTDGNIRVVAADGTGAHQFLSPPAGNDVQPTWSPNGARLAYSNDETIVATGSRTRTFSFGDSPSWSPHARYVAFGEGDGVAVGDTRTGAEETILEDRGAGDSSKWAPAWSPRGNVILFGQSEGGIGVYDVRRKRETSLRTGFLDGDNPAWSPDGRWFAYDTNAGADEATRASSIYVAAADGSGRRRIARNASSPAWSPDGTRIAFVRLLANRNYEIYVMNRDGTRQRRLTHSPEPDVDPAWRR
jgi:TolB protein